MLNIYFGDMKDAVYNTSMYFDNTYLDSWIMDPYAQRIIQSIDKATVLSPQTIDSKALGVIPVKQLSGGTKTLLLLLNDHKKVFNVSTCGDNCAHWVLDIAQKSSKDITINLHHLMDFGDKPFEIKIANNGQIVRNMQEYVIAAGSCLEEG